MKYETIIGIEIHCELKTKTKMFSGAPTSFGEVANTCVNEIDLGHPGTLPCVNKEAVRLAILAATALHCDICLLYTSAWRMWPLRGRRNNCSFPILTVTAMS